MAQFDGFFDNFKNGVLNPKGNLADWQHANRLYINNFFAHAPRTKFLYHVTFYLTPAAQSVAPELNDYSNVVGMLVNSADLPSYEANVETKNQYNRKKNIQTNIEYKPVDIRFYDDNFGATTALLEAYFKYYYADSYRNTGAEFGNLVYGDTTYKGQEQNKYKFGLDNNTPVTPFFDRIEISQISRSLYTKFTLVKPLLTNWKHDNVDNTDDRGTMQNSITVAYESVFYERGSVEAGANGEPAGFGVADKYDTTASPATIQGGGNLGVGGALSGVGSIVGGDGSLGQKAITAGNVFRAGQGINSDDLENFAINSAMDFGSDVLGNLAGTGPDPSKNRQIKFPKTRSRPGAQTQATPSLAGQAASGIENAVGAAQDFAGNAVDTVTDTVGNVTDSVTDTVGDFFADKPQGGAGIDTPGRPL